MSEPESSQPSNTEANEALNEPNEQAEPVVTPAAIVMESLYEGTKRLLAQVMSRGEYNVYRGWKTPDGEDPNDAGYLVEYVDGGQANDPRHQGYISWSPKDVFERTYKLVPASELPPHQQRVVQEVTELTDRAEKLNHFINHNPTYRTLNLDEQTRMSHQLILMKKLILVLNERVAAF